MKNEALDKITDYFANYDFKEPNQPIQQVARTIGVSESSIVRFCQKKGYRGYKDFSLDLAKQRGLSEAIGLGVDLPTDELKNNDTLKDFVKNIFLTNCDTVIKTIDSIDYDVLQKVLTAVKKAHNIFVVGYGNSSPIAMDISLRFARLGFSCFASTEPFADALKLNALTKDDLIIAVSYSGSSTSLVNGLKTAKENGIQRVLLSSTINSKASEYCDLVLITERGNTQAESVATRVAQLSLMDAIFARLVSEGNFNRYKKHVQKIDEYLSGMHTK